METVRVLNLFTVMNRGGAETMVMNYYRRLDKSKVQFDFLVHREERGAYEDEIEAMGGRIYRMIPIYPQNFQRYKRLIHEFFAEHKEYQIIHSHMSELGYFALREAKDQGVPVRICHAHNAPHGWDLKMIMRDYFKRKMMSYVTHMFICGQDSGDWLFGKQNRDRFIQLNNAINADKFRYRPEAEREVRDELGLGGKLVIGHVGRFHKQKNHEFLLDIFAEIAKEKENAILLLAGTGELEDEVKEKARRKGLGQQVLFLGVRTDIERLMQCFDVFLFPSLFEGLPVTMIEAQTAGNLCFISDMVPRQCVITPNVQTVSLKSGPRAWAKRILSESAQYTKRDIYDMIVNNGFDIEKNAKWLEEFYCNCTRGDA